MRNTIILLLISISMLYATRRTTTLNDTITTQSYPYYRYEQARKFNLAVYDIDSMYSKTTNTFADSIYKTAGKFVRIRHKSDKLGSKGVY